MGEKMVICNNLVYKYPESENEEPKVAIDGLDLEVNKGEFLVVLGHNGSGNSTFAKHINALLIPSDGAVYVDGLQTSLEIIYGK